MKETVPFIHAQPKSISGGSDSHRVKVPMMIRNHAKSLISLDSDRWLRWLCQASLDRLYADCTHLEVSRDWFGALKVRLHLLDI